MEEVEIVKYTCYLPRYQPDTLLKTKTVILNVEPVQCKITRSRLILCFLPQIWSYQVYSKFSCRSNCLTQILHISYRIAHVTVRCQLGRRFFSLLSKEAIVISKYRSCFTFQASLTCGPVRLQQSNANIRITPFMIVVKNSTAFRIGFEANMLPVRVAVKTIGTLRRMKFTEIL